MAEQSEASSLNNPMMLPAGWQIDFIVYGGTMMKWKNICKKCVTVDYRPIEVKNASQFIMYYLWHLLKC